MWVIRLAGSAMLAILGWIGAQFQTALIHVAEIRRELEITKPAEIVKALHELRKETLTSEQIQAIIQTNSPWTRDSTDWVMWRNKIDLQTSDRFRKTDMQKWLDALRETNPDIHVPPLKGD